MGYFRIARRFEIETGHRLSRHPEKCRFPHGHSRVVEVVLRAERLDAADMVCDYKALKRLVGRELERYDHAMLLAADDPLREAFAPFAERVVLLEEGDPTTEVIARHLFGVIAAALVAGGVVAGTQDTVANQAGVVLERVRVWETPATWAEYVDGD